jgi:DNA-binding protein HU-beta
MIKKELANVLIDEIGFTKTESLTFLNILIETVKKTVSKGERVTLVGFGTFSLRSRKGRTVKVPGTSKKVKIPNKYVVKFEPGLEFKILVNKKRR